MEIIVHRIRLLSGTDPADFEKWVRDIDYGTCPLLPSLIRFSVQRCNLSDIETAAFHYFEIIEIRSREAFDRDMKTAAFAGLVIDFEAMAEVVEEFAGVRLEPGYMTVQPSVPTWHD